MTLERLPHANWSGILNLILIDLTPNYYMFDENLAYHSFSVGFAYLQERFF